MFRKAASVFDLGLQDPPSSPGGMRAPSSGRPALLGVLLLAAAGMVHSFKLSTKNSPTRALADAERRCVDPIMQKIVWTNPELLAGFAGEPTCEGVPAWDAPLFYSRIPKTGGTMFRTLISAAVARGPDRGYGELPVHGWGHGKHSIDATGAKVKSMLLRVSRRSDSAKQAGFGMYTPQTAYGLHAIGKTPCCYFTILREPYRRMISWFYEAFRGHPTWPSLDAFLSGCNNSFAMHNLQTVQLCGSAPACTMTSTSFWTISHAGSSSTPTPHALWAVFCLVPSLTSC